MIGRKHEIARLQSDFYRDRFRKTLWWLMGSVLIMFTLLSITIYFVLFQPQQRYYANTTEGKILPMQQLRS